jgi:hypothetical protein
MITCCPALVSAFLTVAALADGAGASFPHTDTLLSAQRDDANWILPAKTYAGNRYTALTQIDKTNVGALQVHRLRALHQTAGRARQRGLCQGLRGLPWRQSAGHLGARTDGARLRSFASKCISTARRRDTDDAAYRSRFTQA